jgi:hypothetical protein
MVKVGDAIAQRNWAKFKELEKEFIAQHGVEKWEEFFAFRLKPALDKDSERWLLIQWCSKGIKSVKEVTYDDNAAA